MLKRKWKNRKRREEAWVESLKMRGGGDGEKAVVPVGEAESLQTWPARDT